jgi:hypothetical protein
MSYPKPSELWAMSPLEFNKWRRENDLKKLFNCFQKALPHFDDWLVKNNLTIEFILETDNPGHFFHWKTDVYCVKNIKDGITGFYFVPVEDEKHEKQIQKNKEIIYDDVKLEYFKFTPYFIWVKNVHKLDKPIKTPYSGDIDTFRYIVGTAPDVPEMCSWTIAPGFTVLKLGGTKIDGWGNFVNRNLDFTNLDFLEIDGKHSWSREIQIFYCHCAEIIIKNAVANFTKFYNCSFQNLKSENSRLYWFEFHYCDIFKAYFENTSIANLVIENSSSNNFSFNRVEVENIIYTPPVTEYHSGIGHTYETIADNYKRFRILYQSNGLRQEASDAYYNERLYEFKFNWESSQFLKSFPYLWKKGIDYGIQAIQINFRKLMKNISDIISYSIWGFGEKPLRTIICSLVIILIYTSIYFMSTIDTIGGNLTNSFYLSTIMFSTLGFGDFIPFQTGSYKILLASEALIGVFTFGLFIAGYANKSKY